MDAIDLDAEGADSPDELVTLFKLDGVEYKVSANPRAAVALKGLNYVEKYGPELANLMMLKDLLGEEAFEKLSGCEKLTPKQLAQIVDLAYKLCFGTIEVNPGNS